jgi:type II secretory pathway pseudopilin PulG
MDIDNRNKIIGLVLWVVIIGLAYVLFDSIYTPYQKIVEQRQETEQVRDRMEAIRDALIQYQRDNETFPANLDSLVTYLKTDSLMIARADSLFGRPAIVPYDVDRFTYTIRESGSRFEYALNDTLRPQIYLLSDPDTDDKVGSLERTTMLNASNWD